MSLVRKQWGYTDAYVGLDILVLKVECMLPNVDTDNREVAQERVLVDCCSNLKLLRRLIQTLQSTPSVGVRW